MNEWFAKDSYTKCHSVKRPCPLSEPPDSENSKVAVLTLIEGREILPQIL